MKQHLIKSFMYEFAFLVLLFGMTNYNMALGQSTLYSEDFSSNTGKGQNATTYDMTGVTNWSIDVSNGDFNDGNGDAFKVNGGVFYSKDSDGLDEANACWWYSTVINITNYSNVTIFTDLIPQSSSSSNFVRLYYSLDGGAYVPVGAAVAGNGSSVTRTVAGLSGTTLKVRVGYWGSMSSGSITHDNVLVTGISTCLPTVAPSGISFSNVNSQNLTVSWIAGNGDKSLVIASPAALSANPASGTSYTANYVYGSGSPVGNGYVVFNGPSTTTNAYVSGLDRNTTYTFTIFTYNSSGNCYLEPGTSSSRTTANLPIAFYVDNNSNTNDVFTPSSANGSNAANGRKLTPWATLTYALTQVIPGDTIYVDAGIYTDNALSSPVGGAHIIGAGIAKTYFENPSADSYFMRIDDNNTSLSEMTLRDYNAQTCGGAENGQVLGIIGVTGVKITNMLIDQASTSSDGCGYPIEVRAGASVVFQGGGATCNNWFAGGGIHVSGATTNATINNYLFYGNRKDTQNGSALHVDEGTVVVRNSKFDNNESRSDKRGAGIFQQGGTVSVYDSWFDQNETWLAYDQPGGTILISAGTFTVKRSKFTNHTQGGGSTSYGAAFGITSGNVTIDSCLFSNNSGSASRGKDVYNDGGTVTIRNCTFLSGVNQIGNNSGTMALSNSGSPSATFTTGLTFVNTIAPSYTANPTVPQFTGVCGSITILPIELIDFTGICENTHTHLWWATASEHNNDYFTIDRAGSNGVFYELAKVNGKMNTTQQSEYNFADYYAEEGVNYYRLFQTDVDGKSRELKTISVYNNCLTGSGVEVSASYNSMNNSITVGYNFDRDQMVQAALYNSLGQMVLTTDLFLDASERKTQIDLNETLSFGIYFLKLSNDEFMVSEKILISK